MHLAKTFAEMSLLIGAELFILGWSYLYGYYRAFGILVSEVNFSAQTTLAYALAVAETRRFILGFLAVVLLIAFFQIRRVSNILGHPAFVLIFIVSVGVLSSELGVKVGIERAQRDSVASTSHLPFVVLYGAQADTDATGCRTDDWNYRLLLRANGQIYVVVPIGGATAPNASLNLRVCAFPENRIAAMRMQVGVARN